jgi:glutamate formiminotransferase/glutamate formiminotransferase/formiminotetrahydrofolate cyclodeaminase
MIVECVPNFSEGRDAAIVGGIARAVTGVRHVALFDAVSDPDHNRSVLTFAGPPKATAEAAFEAVRKAVTSIDIGSHQGVHPRLGVADVVPFVPLDGVSLRGCAGIARVVGARIWQELKLPVYLYECAALRPECRRLEGVRKLAPAGLPPDFGEGRHPTAGACVVGARKLLIAWNILLETGDLAIARQIARQIRESNGGLPAVKALGLPLESRGQVQVSINLVDFDLTPLHEVFDAVARECLRRGIEVVGSELIGLIPAAALEASRGHDLQWLNLRPELVIENRLRGLGTE